MRGKQVLLFLFLLLCVHRFTAAGTDCVQLKCSVVLATVQNIRFLSHVEAESSDDEIDEISFSSWYSVTLRVSEVLSGEVRKKKIKVKLRALHEESLKRQYNAPIVLVLAATAEGFDVLYWSEQAVIACIPDSIVKQSGWEKKYGISGYGSPGESQTLCTGTGVL